MNQEEQLATIQKQLDAGEIDFTKLDPERKKVLSKAIEAGVLKSPDSLEFKEIQQRTARERLGQEAKEADTISGVNLPLWPGDKTYEKILH